MDTVQRVRAARGSLNLSLTEFAKAIGIGRQTLIRIENGERPPKVTEYEQMAKLTGLPLEFFTAPDLHEALAGAGQQPTLSEQLEELRAQQAEDSTRLAQLEEVVRELAARDRPVRGAGGARG